MANYCNLVVASLEDNCERTTAFHLVFEMNSARIVNSQPQRAFEGVYFCTSLYKKCT